MKKHLLFLSVYLLFSFSLFADNEKLSVLINDQTGGNTWYDVPTSVGIQVPCTPMLFRVQFSVPSAYPKIIKFDWYLNNTLVKTTTDNEIGPDGTHDAPAYIILISKSANSVVCKVTYSTSDGSSSVTKASPGFIIVTKPYHFDGINGPANPNIGNQSVSYSLTAGNANNYELQPVQGEYSITWQSPVNWTQTSLSNNGQNVSFTTDQYSAGTLKATISLNACPYTDTRTLNISRPYPAPSFSSGNPGKVCGSSTGSITAATFAITPVSLATSYTYYISPSYGDASNIAFSANGQQTITTTSTSVEISYANQTDQVISFGVQANYPNGGVSPIASVQIPYFVTPIQWSSSFHFEPNCFSANGSSYTPFEVTAPYVMGGYYYWYMDGFMVDQGASSTSYLWWQGESVLSVKVQTQCGVSDLYSETFPMCGSYSWSMTTNNEDISLYPNPASNEVTINLKSLTTVNKSGNRAMTTKGKLGNISEIRILDKFGGVRKIIKYSAGTKSTKVNVSSLPNDVYMIEISDGTNKRTMQLNKIN